MKLETLYSVGDTVYHPEVAVTTVQIRCPDCLGSKTWTAKLLSGEEVTFRCPSCTHGYECRGTIADSFADGCVLQLTVGSVRFDSAPHHDGPREVEYMCEETGVDSGRVWREGVLYDTYEDAEAALPGAVERRQIELDELRAKQHKMRKANDPGSMAAHYRAQIRAAKKDIAAAERGLEREANRK